MKQAERMEYRDRIRKQMKTNEHGFKYLPLDAKEISHDTVHVMFATDEKLGDCYVINFPVVWTCDHNAPCFTGNAETDYKGICYGRCGRMAMTDSIICQLENLLYFRHHTPDEMVEEICRQIKKPLPVRWFGVGDIVNAVLYGLVICKVAERKQKNSFWLYTKKYHAVNSWVDKNGLDSIPENLVTIFSKWENDTFKLVNPYNFPVAEFIPYCKEVAEVNVTKLCDCFMPWRSGHCDECENGCRTLKHGETVGFAEHSTKATKKRDKKIKEHRGICIAEGITTKEAYIKRFGADAVV